LASQRRVRGSKKPKEDGEKKGREKVLKQLRSLLGARHGPQERKKKRVHSYIEQGRHHVSGKGMGRLKHESGGGGRDVLEEGEGALHGRGEGSGKRGVPPRRGK